MLQKYKRGQVWFMDFTIALLLFTFTLGVYFSYTNNLQNPSYGSIDLLSKDAQLISSALSVGGYPSDWNSSNVVRIGLLDDQSLNATKAKKFGKLNYSISKSKLGTSYDYFVFFLNKNGEVINVNSVCGAGHPSINMTYNLKSAYYYQDEDDSFLKDFMIETFSADVYNDDISELVSNLSKYQLLVMEHALLSGGEFNSNKDEIENYSSSGGLLMISGELAAPATNTLVGADFKKKSGQSSSQRTAVVNNTDEYLSLIVGQSMVFDQYYYVKNNSNAKNFMMIATFNESGDHAISRWKYGNGSVYFFSDFDVSEFGGDFVGLVKESAAGLVEGTCSPVNLTPIAPKNLVNAERYVGYNSKLIKMVVYVWA